MWSGKMNYVRWLHITFPLLGLGHVRIHNMDGVDYLHNMSHVDCRFSGPGT